MAPAVEATGAGVTRGDTLGALATSAPPADPSPADDWGQSRSAAQSPSPAPTGADLAVGSPGRRAWSWRRFVLEAVVVFVFYSAYEWLRAQVAGAPGIAQHHALQIVRLERDLAMFHEAAVQRWFLPNHPIIQGWDIYYGTVHFAGPILGLFWLYVRFPDRYRRWRDVLAATTLLGLLGFWLYPLAPPRLLPSHFGFVDTALRIGGMGVADKGSNRDTENLFAAMPSLHLGWSCWCAFALTPVLRRRAAKVFVLAYPLVTLTAVVVTANHYVLDGVGGLAAVMLGWLLVDGAIRLRRDHGWWWLPLARGT